MQASELAAKLNGTEKVTKEMIALARDNGLVIVYGHSDDLVEIDGALSDELSAYNGVEFKLDDKGPLCAYMLEDCDDPAYVVSHVQRYEKAHEIKAVWQDGEPCWLLKTEIPCERFTLLDEGCEFSQGLVIRLADLSPALSFEEKSRALLLEVAALDGEHKELADKAKRLLELP